MKKPLSNLALGFCALALSFSASAVDLKFNTQDFPPFSYTVDGVIAGPGIEIIRKVCAEMDIKCSFEMLTWIRAQKEVKEGTAQGMFFIGKHPAREEWLYFSPPIVNASYGFFVNMDNALEYKTPADISGYTVGVYGPSNTATSLGKLNDQLVSKGLKPFIMDMRPNEEAGFQKLSLNRINAVFSNHDVGNAKIAKLGLKNIRYAGTHQGVTYYIGFPKKHVDKAIVDQFNSTLVRLQKSGDIGKILERHQMKDLPQNSY